MREIGGYCISDILEKEDPSRTTLTISQYMMIPILTQRQIIIQTIRVMNGLQTFYTTNIERYIMTIKKFIYRIRFFLSHFKKYEHKEHNFIYEQDDE